MIVGTQAKMNIDVEEIQSVRQKSLFRVEGFMFQVDKRKEDKLYCRCIRKFTDSCSARVIISKVSIATRHSERIIPLRM